MRRTVREPPVTDWWIVETAELGVFAAPSWLLAQQAAEVVKGRPYGYTVIAIRRAAPGVFPCDAMAIQASEKEISECGVDMLVRSGAMQETHHARRDTGRIITLGS